MRFPPDGSFSAAEGLVARRPGDERARLLNARPLLARIRHGNGPNASKLEAVRREDGVEHDRVAVDPVLELYFGELLRDDERVRVYDPIRPVVYLFAVPVARAEGAVFGEKVRVLPRYRALARMRGIFEL